MSEQASDQTAEPVKRKVNFLALTPLLAVLALGGVFGYQLLFGDPAHEIPSALIGQQVPAVALAPLDDSGVPLSEDDRFQIIGINQKDQPADARRFLATLGNPYDRIGVDPDGRASIEWGVYGVPETFLVGPDGVVLYKHIGVFDERHVREIFLPIIEEALAPAAPAS